MKIVALSLMAALFVSCGKNDVPSGTPVVLQLQLPAALLRSSRRYQRFQERAEALEIVLETKGGEKVKERFPPNQWEKIALPSFRFPAYAEDSLSVEVRIWDRTRERLPRATPALIGSAKFDARDADSAERILVNVKLRMEVAAGEYD